MPLAEPLNVAEVLTVRQVVVLRIHTHARAESSSMVGLYRYLEGVVIALVGHHLKWTYAVHLMTLGYQLRIERYQLESYSIYQALLVYHITHLVDLACFAACIEQFGVLRHHVDGIPALGHGFLPLSYLLSQTVVIGSQTVETLLLSRSSSTTLLLWRFLY